jgi:putative ABC transport system permease protein
VLPLNNTNMKVVGILEQNGSNEDYQIFVPLRVLQIAFGKEGLISSIDVRALCNACPVELIADAINKEIPGVRALAVKQVAATEMGMLERINKLLLALAGVTLLIGGFGVTNTLLTSVHERIKDIGIMRSVGASRGQIIKVLIYEAIIIGIAGGFLGFLGGTLLGYLAGPLIFDGIAVRVVPWYFPLCLGISIIVSVAATLYPAFRATGIRVADSFRAL